MNLVQIKVVIKKKSCSYALYEGLITVYHPNQSINFILDIEVLEAC